ncbi:MAG: hypothetical protein COU44_02915 [Candidatus Nealsonbacteria bacterium CG10_big_fil_rev_8_21_14_0_10_40_24]|nr:MAG: hypothetical protein COU44_02915 [Candidatus Nealsonbacteria bacterium CG10_big_fil_rev_8_21_14_0_10_40_24]
MKTILVTGGAGFIGSNLCERLLNEGNKVICLDSLITGNIKNISPLFSNPNFIFIRHDISKPVTFSLGQPQNPEAISFHLPYKIDYLLNLACPASPVDFPIYPLEILLTCSYGTKNMLDLALAHQARFIQASTSEVYGDPIEHPQKETYFGNVNPYGPRSCYDEGKRYAEALTYNYRKKYGLNTGIVRIFNSILGDQPVFVLNDGKLYLETIEKYVQKLEQKGDVQKRKIYVPSFDPISKKMKLRQVSAIIKHPCLTDTYELSLRYGRKVKVTGDHSVFTQDKVGQPVAKPVRMLRKGDYVAIPAKIPVIEKDFPQINVAEHFLKRLDNNKLWGYTLFSSALQKTIIQKREEINRLIEKSGRYKTQRYRNGIVDTSNRFKHQSFLPLSIVKQLNLQLPHDASLKVFSGGAHIYVPNEIKITNDILWLLGFFVAEGSFHWKDNKSYFLTFSSDIPFLKKAKKILEKNFGVKAIYQPPREQHPPSLFIHSKVLYLIFKEIFGLIGAKRLPNWILQLPLRRLKYFLEGYKDGDGTHSGKMVGEELAFNTSDSGLASDLNIILMRFGIVASLGKYKTTYKQRYGEKTFPFYRLTVCKLNDFNILNWDRGVKQTLNARRIGDLVWAQVKTIRKCLATTHVYDFSVPGFENFIAGNGVCCHNTYGPLMRPDDGRVVSNFIVQALKGEDLTVYGDGSQTRSFCYIDDMIEGIIKMMESEGRGPVNLGNPEEFTILELAKKVIELTGSKSSIIYKSLPENDPKQRKPDITLAKNKLHWQPKISLEEGLPKTIEWFKSLH